MLLFRLIPILVNGMKYSEIDIILLKVRYEPDEVVTVDPAFYTRTDVNTEISLFHPGRDPRDSFTQTLIESLLH